MKKILFFLIAIVLSSTVVGCTNISSSVTDNQQETIVIDELDNIVYETVNGWEIPNGGYGKNIVISLDLFTKDSMPLVGKKLHSDAQYSRNAVFMVYTSKEAVLLKDKVLNDKATSKENELYDKSFVGQYFKNGNSSVEEFIIYYDGLLGIDSQTITY